MSSDVSESDQDVVEPLICEYCGTYISEPDQECPALADGRCRP